MLLMLFSGTVAAQQPFDTTAFDISLHWDGAASVTHIISVNGTEPSITLPLLITPVENILVLNQSGAALGFEEEQQSLVVYTLGSSNLTVTYDTPSLASVDGGVWTAKLNLLYDAKVILPEGAVLTSINDTPTDLTSIGNKPLMSLKAGAYEIIYAAPVTAAPASTPQPSQPPITQPTAVPPVPATSTPPSPRVQEPQNSPVTETQQVKQPLGDLTVIAIIVIVIAAVAAVVALRSARRRKKGGAGSDNSPG